MTTTGIPCADSLDTVPELDSSLLHLALPGLSGGVLPTGSEPGIAQPECRSTRAALSDYLNSRLTPNRKHHLEAHLDGCAECIRAFIDIREVAWRLHSLAQSLLTAGHVRSGGSTHSFQVRTSVDN